MFLTSFDTFLPGCQRVWLQFKWFLCLPEPEQDWRDPVTEQDPQSAENQVSVPLWEIEFTQLCTCVYIHKHNWVVFLCLLGMATCSFFSHPQLDPPVRTWTQLSLTLLLLTLPSLHPLHHHLPYPVHTLHHRSKRTRLTSICPNKRERSTETKTPSCKSASLTTLHWKKFLYHILPKPWSYFHAIVWRYCIMQPTE